MKHSGHKFPADLVIFTEEILNAKLHFLCSAGKDDFDMSCRLTAQIVS